MAENVQPMVNVEENDEREENPIRQLLLQTTEGKLILKAYRDNGCLTKNLRNLMTRLILKKEKDLAFHSVQIYGEPDHLRKFVIKKERFMKLARQICQLFPCEITKTYYTPYMRIGSRRINPSGTLFEHFQYQTGILRKGGLLSPTNRVHFLNTPYQVSEHENALLCWLKNHLDPVETVQTNWEATFGVRRDLLKNKITISNYYRTLPCLTVANGVELLKNDFNRLHPGKNESLFERWELIREHLIKRLQECTIRNSSEKAFVHLLPTLLLHNKDAVICFLLPYLIEGAKEKRRNTENEPAGLIKLSVQERRDSFILHVQTAADIEAGLDQRRKEFEAANLTLQPIPIFVGPLVAIDTAYVAVNEVLYKVDSALHAIDTCFKIFIALDCAYPRRASSIWLFFQICGYQINYATDTCNRSLNSLIGEIKRHIQLAEP